MNRLGPGKVVSKSKKHKEGRYGRASDGVGVVNV